MELGAAHGQWNLLYIDPPITETGVTLVATKYSYDQLDIYPGGLSEISIDGAAGN